MCDCLLKSVIINIVSGRIILKVERAVSDKYKKARVRMRNYTQREGEASDGYKNVRIISIFISYIVD